MKKTLLIKQNRQALLIWLIMAANPALAQLGSSPATAEQISNTPADSIRVAWTVDSLDTVPATLTPPTAANLPRRLIGVATVPSLPRASAITSSKELTNRKSSAPAKPDKTPRFWKLELAVGTDWQSLRSGRGRSQLAGRAMLDLPLVMNRAHTYGVGVGIGTFVCWTRQEPGTNSFVLPYAALTWRQRVTSHLYAVARGLVALARQPGV